MAHRTVHLACLVSLLALTSASKEQTRWSRQLSTYTSDISDWVPLRGPIEREPEPAPQVSPIKRQAVAEPRILTEPFPGMPRPTGFSSDAFASRNYFNSPANRQGQLYLQSVPSVPSAPQNYLTDQGFGQSLRFGLSQPNFALSQGFVAPPFGYENVPPPPPPKQTRPQVSLLPNDFRKPLNQVSFPQASGVPLSVQAKPFLSHPQKPDIPKFVDGYRAENASNEFAFAPKKKPQSLQKIKFDSGEKIKTDVIPQTSKSERGEEVQLLYVPIEQLNRGQFNFRSPLQTSQLVNSELFSQGVPRPNPGKQTFLNDFQRPAAKPLESFSGQNLYANFNTQLKDVDQVSKYTTHTTPFITYAPTTPKPKKLKPHQPPLAIFMTKDPNKNTQVKVGDVLSSLKNAGTIAVLDSVNPQTAPKVFIGPSNLPPPENFVKFELPYLSNIEHSDNKLKQLPFFVAPLSYNTPNGFAKIPFPSPHVGSVVINSQIKETSQTQAPTQSSISSINPNYYSVTPPTYKPETKPTQKPTFSYYSTAAPKTKPPPNYQSNFYSFEPQTVSSIRPPTQAETQTAPPKPGSYFIGNSGTQYNSQEFANFQPHNSFKSSEAIDQYNFPRQPDHRTTLRTTTTTTTKPPSTYPSQLLETHNPYSINQAFHFSTPLDYHNYFEDVKQPYVTPGSVPLSSPSPSPTPAPQSPSSHEPKPEQISTEKPKYHQQSSPSYLNNYTPEIHYDSDQNLKYPVFNHNDYVSKTEVTSQQSQPGSTVDNNSGGKYNPNVDTPINKYSSNEDSSYNQYTNVDSAIKNYETDSYNKYSTNTPTNSYQNLPESPANNNYNTYVDTSAGNYKVENNVDTTSPVGSDISSEVNNLPTVSELETPSKYDEYNNYDVAEVSPTSSTTTTTTTTRRTPIRSRGRPRYTTTPRSDSYESTTRVVATRRPLRERRPLPTRSRYEPNKISTEKPIRKPIDSNESTTKSSRSRTRGRIHYKPTDSDEPYERRKTHNSKEEDLAYQRDVLHQNYPVTLMERMSTVDIEAITEPTVRQSSVKIQEPVTETIDTENAYTNERASISEQQEIKDESPLPTYTARSTLQTETPYVPKLPSTRHDEYYYQSRSSVAPVEPSSYDENADEKEDDIYAKQTTPLPKPEKSDAIVDVTEAVDTDINVQNYPGYNEYVTVKQEEATTVPETEAPKTVDNHEPEEEEENVVQTTPSYNRVRVRPGLVRQYHQASSTESSKPKERKRPSQPVTYRPAFDRRRTTMRIDEIEADLKTKQVHARPEQEYRHPVYKPEATTEPASQVTTESTTKRGHFRRRRPTYSYSTTSTEASSTKRTYEVKNRFRGRRPTEKPTTEKPEVQTEAPTSTTRTSLHSRYSHRPRLSERYNKKPEPEPEVEEDQDSNYSINRPTYTEPDVEQWSPKIASDSFKPYNPNDIVDEQKVATTERRSDKDYELDIITARNEYDDILLTVTPASNNRMNKKIPDIPPTLEALVEQSKVTKSDSVDAMSTFESMLEEVMKSLEEQDQDEYSTNVMKHKGGEIGEIPPERIISSGDNYAPKSTTPVEEITTEQTTADDVPPLEEDDHENKSRRRGFWKKVKVRPVTPESIEFAESQYYTNTVNRLGQPVNTGKVVHDKFERGEKTKVTTYKPKFQFIKDLFTSDDDITDADVMPTLDIHKINKESEQDEILDSEESQRTTAYLNKETQTISPGDLDLGTGSPDPTIDDLYLTTPTEPIPTHETTKADTFSFMDYLFGVSSDNSEKENTTEEKNATRTTLSDVQETTEVPKSKIVTTESGYIPEEITDLSENDDSTNVPEFSDIKKVNPTEESKTEKSEDTTEISVRKVESSSVSSFMDPANFFSTSMSTEISHETEICFRGKCIKTNKDIL